MIKNICVYCSSCDFIDRKYFEVAKELGIKIAQNGYNMVYGGSSLGLMGEVANNAVKSGAKVLGVVPEKIYNTNIEFSKDIKLIITKDMRERKKTMELNADAFIAMPGGFGTLEEISEIIVGKQLAYHKKPIVFLNAHGFYDDLFVFFDKLFKEKFAKIECKTLFYNAKNVDDALDYIKNYVVDEDNDKWLEKFTPLK